jgi:hypothetical protein
LVFSVDGSEKPVAIKLDMNIDKASKTKSADATAI